MNGAASPSPMAGFPEFGSILQSFQSWRRGQGVSLDLPPLKAPRQQFRTERTTTVFSGEASEWLEYLALPWDSRRDETLFIVIRFDPDRRTIGFEGQNDYSGPWADWFNEGIRLLKEKFQNRPVVTGVLEQLLFGNASNGLAPIHFHMFAGLPSPATREILVDDHLSPIETDIVVQSELLQSVEAPMRALADQQKATGEELLGTLWPVLRRVIQQLAYPSYPRDRFTDRIELTTKMTFLSLHVLFEKKSAGRLVANRAGELYQQYVAKRHGLKIEQLRDTHPYFRMFEDVSFLLREELYAEMQEAIKVVVRDYLDNRYLRLSLAGIMPDTLPWMDPMEFEEKKNKIVTPKPKLGRYGILDDEDLVAWKEVRGPLMDAGYAILGQLGIGQFGRVYEAFSFRNRTVPERVAIKVDRILKGKRSEAIQAAEVIMDIGRRLSHSPHVIRIFDAGKIRKGKYTYHVLQLVEGSTLDDLIGVTGQEHSSIYRPEVARTDLQALRDEYMQALNKSHSEAWRRSHTALPFTDPLSLAMLLDILVSNLLWLEETHQIGFAINDLKNGNLMLNRRGALKGIDLDSYSPIFSPLDKITDFFFLAVSMLLFHLRTLVHEDGEAHLRANELLSNPKRLEQLFAERWPFGDVSRQSNGRLDQRQLISLFCTLIDDARTGVYAHEPERFSAAIDHLIYLKRLLTQEEIILD